MPVFASNLDSLRECFIQRDFDIKIEVPTRSFLVFNARPNNHALWMWIA
jgi:hypothetical protein